MTKLRYYQALLELMVRAQVDGQLPSYTMACRRQAFLSQVDAMESYNPAFALEALADWVPRLVQGITDSGAFVTIQHPPAMHSTTQQSTPYMDLVADAIITVPSSIPVPEDPTLRFTLVRVHSHRIVANKLTYWGLWEGSTDCEEEVYQNIHHLHVFKAYEESIVPLHWAIQAISRCKSARQKEIMAHYTLYIKLRDEAISQLTEEFDTDSEEEEDLVTTLLHDKQHSSPLENIASDDSISWGDLLVPGDAGQFMPTNLDLGGSFCAEGLWDQTHGDFISWMDRP
jgi:hypothetical protein